MNEDAAGVHEQDGQVRAAWVFDGVTGINENSLLDVVSEPAWFVEVAQRHLCEIIVSASDTLDALQALVPRLEREWKSALGAKVVPAGYDLPAACLTLVLRVGEGWQALRLGDSYVLSRGEVVHNHPFPPSDLPDLEAELRLKAEAFRSQGEYDFNALRKTFSRSLMSSRQGRNEAGSHSILVPHTSSLAMPQVIDLGTPHEILLCTDGYYRAVDTYLLHSDESLLQASAAEDGVMDLLERMRAIEAQDPQCQKFPRFKPADDASAIMLKS